MYFLIFSSPLSSSKAGLPVALPLSKSYDPSHHHHLQLHPRTRAILEQITGSEKTLHHSDRIETPGQISRHGGLNQDKDYPYVKFPRRELPHEYSYPKLIESHSYGEDRISSAKSSFKKSHIPIEKTNSGGSDNGKVSLVLIGSGSSFGSSSNYESSHSGSVDGKRQQATSKKLFLPSEDAKAGLACSGSPAKTSLTGLSPMLTLTCVHCRETFCLEDNRVTYPINIVLLVVDRCWLIWIYISSSKKNITGFAFLAWFRVENWFLIWNIFWDHFGSSLPFKLE